jgi:hypothetical protein
MQNLVINICDVSNKCDVISTLCEPATQNIEVHTRANMADMWGCLDGSAAEIDPHFTGLEWNEGRSGSREGVI